MSLPVKKIIYIVCLLVVALLASNASAFAQVVDPRWSGLHRLSSAEGQAGDQVMFADEFGYVHVFWPESGFPNRREIIMYARFDGQEWSPGVDIFLLPLNYLVGALGACVDPQGVLHLVFTLDYFAPVFYTSAPIADALSAQAWSRPVEVGVTAYKMRLSCDAGRGINLLYSSLSEQEPGIYFTNSTDQGLTWSSPHWLDPDISIGLIPGVMQLESGSDGVLHAIWNYTDRDLLGRWLRYSHSLDGGETWSTPFTIEDVPPGSDAMRMPHPSLAVSGEDVHVVWAGDYATHREYRYSGDGGETWNQPTFIFGDLLGQALGDGLAVDSLGRPHFVGQIRWPQGVYHAYWENGEWSLPEMVYYIARDAADDIGERVHSHRVRLAIRAGNQLVMTMTTNPSAPRSILYGMFAPIEDAPPLPTQAMAGLAITSDETPSLDGTPVSGLTSTAVPFETTSAAPKTSLAANPPALLLVGLLPTILIIAGFVIVRLATKRR